MGHNTWSLGHQVQLPSPILTDLYVTCCYQVTQVRPLECQNIDGVVRA